jgi:hypothetical protein
MQSDPIIERYDDTLDITKIQLDLR